ncbi:MAG TPA: UvrD-helicase domain-containing protein [Planctomycetota bacterium]
MTTSPHRLIHASAGTGKTYQLSGRYLELVFAGVEPRSILATTFTRKAAGEIQDRVLQRLAEAAREPGKLAELGRQIGRTPSRDEVQALLARLTRRLVDMRVRTLDAFFVHLARLFSLELGLPSEWSIADDAEEKHLQREAVARTLASTPTDELLVLLRGLQRADASRSVERTLLAEVEQGRNAYLESHAEAWRVVRAPAGASERERRAALARLRANPLPLTKTKSPRNHWRNAQRNLLAAVEGDDWRAFMELTLVKRVVEGGDEFDTETITDDWREPIELLLRQATHELVQEVVRYNAAAHAWLERFEQRFDAVKSEERVYRFEDLPKALHPRDADQLGALEALWYRLDGRLDHLLLDEFQDTAPVQWRILARLAEEILADGTARRSFFCVGDLKQSIYGFREAEPRLLAGLATLYPVLAPEPLARSFRSSQVVLDTVDRVFAGIGANAAFRRDEHRQAAREFQADYGPHTAAKDLPGAAWLLEAPPGEEDEDPLVGALRLAAQRARAIHDEAPEATIGILLRRNVPIARTIFLLRDVGLRASGEGGNPLTDSAAVLHALSLLHLADHPGDSAAAFHVASSPLGPALGLSPAGYLHARAPVAEDVRRRLALEGYGAFLAALLPAVDAGYGAWDRRRFRQLVDLAHAHDERADLRADRFVERVRLTRVEDPAAAQVQVMTVHSAKGLEFDAVILPELNGTFLPQRSEILTERPDPAGLITAVSRAPAEEVCKMEGTLEELWSARERRELREALCLLYVAMTRARHRLEMIVQHRRKPAEPSANFAGVLCAALGALGPAREGVLWSHEESHGPWFTPRGARAEVAERAEPRPAPFLPPRSRPLAQRAPSAREGDGRRRARDLLRAPRSTARLAGDLVHRWLSRVEWLEDFHASDAELLALGRDLASDDGVLRTALGDLRTFLAQPVTRATLALGSAPRAERSVWRERPFSVVLDEPDGTRAVWSGAFDRVVLHGRPGAWTRALLIDFKTDDVSAAAVAERAAFYRPQLESYARVLAALAGLAPEAIEARLLFLRLDRLV